MTKAKQAATRYRKPTLIQPWTASPTRTESKNPSAFVHAIPDYHQTTRRNLFETLCAIQRYHCSDNKYGFDRLSFGLVGAVANPRDQADSALHLFLAIVNMGVIRKKIATRGGEGGVKYVCDVCSADITSTVRAYAIYSCPLCAVAVAN